MQRLLMLLGAALIISGCNAEEEKSAFLCETAENKYIDGSTGFRDVFRLNLGYGIDIGYSHRGVLVPHSECAPARVTNSGVSTAFEYFEYGQATEVDGIRSITFSPLSTGKQAFAVERENKPGQATFEWGERNYDPDDAGRLTKQVWLSEFPIDQIVSERDFEGSGVTQAVAHLGQASKTIRYNDNTTLFDCVYSDITGNVVDRNCEQEAQLDAEYFDTSVDLMPYIDALYSKPRYETEPREICGDVNRYAPDDGSCPEY